MFSLIITLALAVITLSAISLPMFEREEEPIYKGLHDRRRHPRISWQEAGYTEYCKQYIY